jgi:hypothetical protein
MRELFAIVAALACMSAPALAQQQATPAVILLNPDSDPPDTEGIVIPTGSPLHLASFSRDEISVKFNGRFELSGTYEIEASDEDPFVTIWPDQKSKDRLPYWHDRGGPDELYISNGWAFAEAVASKEELAKFKAGRQPLIRGQVTMIADEYETGIECDAANFSARFVSVVMNVEMAAAPVTEEGC